MFGEQRAGKHGIHFMNPHVYIVVLYEHGYTAMMFWVF